MLPWTMPLYLPVKVPLLFLISYVFPPYIGHSQVSVPSFRSPLTDDIIIRIYVKIINRCMFLKYGLMLYYCVLSIFFVRFSYFIRCFLRHFIYYSVFCCYFHIYHSVFFSTRLSLFLHLYATFFHILYGVSLFFTSLHICACIYYTRFDFIFRNHLAFRHIWSRMSYCGVLPVL